MSGNSILTPPPPIPTRTYASANPNKQRQNKNLPYAHLNQWGTTNDLPIPIHPSVGHRKTIGWACAICETAGGDSITHRFGKTSAQLASSCSDIKFAYMTQQHKLIGWPLDILHPWFPHNVQECFSSVGGPKSQHTIVTPFSKWAAKAAPQLLYQAELSWLQTLTPLANGWLQYQELQFTDSNTDSWKHQLAPVKSVILLLRIQDFNNPADGVEKLGLVADENLSRLHLEGVSFGECLGAWKLAIHQQALHYHPNSPLIWSAFLDSLNEFLALFPNLAQDEQISDSNAQTRLEHIEGATAVTSFFTQLSPPSAEQWLSKPHKDTHNFINCSSSPSKDTAYSISVPPIYLLMDLFKMSHKRTLSSTTTEESHSNRRPFHTEPTPSQHAAIQQLSHFDLAVQPKHHFVICSNCHVGLQQDDILNHLLNGYRHVGTRAGHQRLRTDRDFHQIEALRDILSTLHTVLRDPPTPPTGPATAIAGLTVHNILICPYTTCPYFVLDGEQAQNSLINHIKKAQWRDGRAGLESTHGVA
ncbi:hypothetical protein T439DRAFT_371328, partial [Meredithblackwellia eburnea MCA 4105]